ncbi:MAG: hypothetical protein ABI721_03695 [Candidatus Dojkabacteria bacterium]
MRLKTILSILTLAFILILLPQKLSAHSFSPPSCQPSYPVYSPKVEFLVNNTVVTTTSSLTVKVRYSLPSIPKEDIGERFADVFGQWHLLPQLEQVPAKELRKRNIAGEWDFWPLRSNKIEETVTFPGPGTYTKYIQVGDQRGKIVTAQATVVITGIVTPPQVPPQPPIDKTTPVVYNVLLSQVSGDLSNPEKTNTVKNFLMFSAKDSESGIGMYSYSLDGTNYSPWSKMSTTLNSIPVDFGTVNQNQVLIAYLKVKDLAGNQASIVQDSIIYYVEPPKDTTAPTITTILLSPVSGDLSNPEKTDKAQNYLMFSATDSESGIGMYSYSLDGTNFTSWSNMINGLNSVPVDFGTVAQNQTLTAYLKVKDNAGNEAQSAEARTLPAQDSITYYVEPPKDITTPLITSVLLSSISGDLSNPAITNNPANYIMFTATDSESGVGTFSYSLDGGITYSPWQNMAEGLNIWAISFDGDQIIEGQLLSVYLKVKDKAGNEYVSQAGDHFATDSITFKGSVIARVTINNNAAYTNSTALSLSTAISTGPGTVLTQYRYAESASAIATTPWLNIPTPTYFTLNGSVNGMRYVCIQAKNSVGTISEIYCDSIALDTVYPGTSVSTAGTIYDTNVLLYNGGSDAPLPGPMPGSGNIMLRYSIDGTAWTAWEAFTPTKALVVGDWKGTHTIQVQARDDAGNLALVMSVPIIRL